MLSVASVGSGEYYANLAREDYYTSSEGGEPLGHWFGSGAKRLGLTGEIDNDQFREVFEGFLNGTKLTQNAGRNSRHPGWDLTFSCPKSVSVAWSQADRETSQEIRAAHLSAVEKALEYLETHSGLTRRGIRGVHFEKADLIFGTFEHGTNRKQEPNLHTHAVWMNACVREDGTTGSVYARPIFQEKMTAGAIYRAELAYQLGVRLGLTCVADGRSFKVVGVSEELCDFFSSRAREIRELALRLGIENPSADTLATLAVTSRDHKAHLPREKLLERWQEIGKEFGFGPKQLQELLDGLKREENQNKELTAKLITESALEKITQNRSTFTESDLICAVAIEAQSHGISAEEVIEASKEILKQSREVVSLGIDTGKPRVLDIGGREKPVLSEPGAIRFTTREILELEQTMLQKVEASKSETSITVSKKAFEDSIVDRPTIKEEQTEMVKYLTQGEGRIKTVVGDAGTGKTYALEAVKEALDSEGYQVLGCALAGIAAKGMSDIGIESRTIASTLWWLENQPDNPKGVHLDEHTMLIVDEAGMVDTRQMAKLVEYTEKSGAALVLVGDFKQLQAIEMGGSFKEIVDLTDGVRLEDIIRQQKEGDREAVKNISMGNAKEFLSYHMQEGNLRIAEDRFDAKERLISDWKDLGGIEHPEKNLIFCCTNSDVTYLNRAIQNERLLAGELGGDCLELGKEDLIYQEDRVVFTKPDKWIGVVNGDAGTVSKIDEKLNAICVELDDGSSRTIPLDQYEHVKLSYAITSHRGQGQTVDNGFVLTDDTMTHREIAYVQASRHRFETRIYSTKIEAGEKLASLCSQMERSRAKELAVTQAKKFEPIPKPEPENTQSPDLGYF